MSILVTKSTLPPFEEYIQEIKEIWDTHWLTNMGVKHDTLQALLEEKLDSKHVVLYTNGHLALENIITAFNFPKEAEVITTPFTFASTTHPGNVASLDITKISTGSPSPAKVLSI